MLSTILLLVLCALTAIAGAPLIFKLIPPNELFGMRTERALAREDFWYELNWFAGWALVIAAGLTALALMIWTGTLLRPFWRQVLTYVVLVGIAVGATFWYERELARNGVRPKRRRKRSSSTRSKAAP
jgi:uncharacterized membrane protein